MILTADLGTSVTKVALWGERGLVALSGMPVDTVHPAPGYSEQEPSEWWASLEEACARLRDQVPGGFESVEAVGCTGARQTFALVDARGEALGPAILWSDRRAVTEAEALARDAGNGQRADARTGSSPDAGSVAAKLAWLATHEPARLDASAWILAPRDLVVWRMTGEVVTDATMASRSGLYDLDVQVVERLAGDAASRLPPVVPSDRVSGHVTAASAAALGLPAGTPVVIGAGDRACEVLGSGATESSPMVSWGTTANVSMPVPHTPTLLPPGMVLSRAARGGWLLEGGLSAAGSYVAWLSRLSGHPSAELAALAKRSPPGARGVVATPWLEGARAPWWRHDAGAAFVGLAATHGLEDLARAVFESVAWEVQRCLRALATRRPEGVPACELVLGGAGAAIPVWRDVLTGIIGLPVNRRRSGQAASAGAALLAAAAVGRVLDLDLVDPADGRSEPDPAATERYAELQEHVERVAAAVVDLAGSGPEGHGGPSPTSRPGLG